MKRIQIIKNKTKDIRGLLLEYCQEYYIPFLRESNDKKLQERYNKIESEEHKQKAISKFVRSNECRIHLLLDSLYRPDLNEGCIYTEKYFIEQHVYDQESILSQLYRTFLLSFTYQTNLVQRNNSKSYISPNAQLVEETRCYEYRLSPRLYRDDQIWERFRLEISDRLHRAFTSDPKTKRQNHYNKTVSEHGQNLQLHYDEWRVNTTAIPDELIEVYNKWKDERYYYTDKYNVEKRVYHPIIGIPKPLRPYLYFEDKNEEHQIVELSNSHHYFFSIILLKEMDLSDIQINQINSLGQALHIVSIEHKWQVLNGFKSVMKGRALSKFYRAIEADYELNLKTDLIEFDDPEKAQLTLYILMSLSGCLYDTLMLFDGYTKMERKKFKRILNSMFNQHTEEFYKAWGVHGLMRDKLTYVYDKLFKVKKNNYKNFWYRITRSESEFVQKFQKKLLEKKIPFIGIHDGILISIDKSHDLLNAMMNESRDKYGITAPLKLEAVG